MALAKHETAEKVCDVAGCSNPAERSFNIKQVAKSSLTLKSQDLRQVHLCKEHYKEFKKETKNERELDQVYRSACSTFCSWGREPPSPPATAPLRRSRSAPAATSS